MRSTSGVVTEVRESSCVLRAASKRTLLSATSGEAEQKEAGNARKR